MTVGKMIDETLILINETYQLEIQEFLKEMICSEDYLPFDDPLSIVINGNNTAIDLRITPKYGPGQIYTGAVILIDRK